MSKDNPRIAVLGFAIECNQFAPVRTAADFEQDVDIRGNQIVSEARSGASITMPDLPGFFTEMDRTGQWTPVPLRVSLAQPGGPVEESFFRAFLSDIEAGLKAALPLDAVFISAHGAALAEGTDDPDGDLFEVVRGVVGPDIPVVAVFDLHANVSHRMIDNLSVFVGYLENPHTDIYERGVEAAKHMRECLAGARTAITMVKVPLVPPQIALLTAKGPYADLIRYGQTKLGGDILNVSVMAGFAYSDSPKNGLTAVVTARNANRQGGGRACRSRSPSAPGSMKERFKRAMMSLGDAVQLAASVGARPAAQADHPGRRRRQSRRRRPRQHDLSPAGAEERRRPSTSSSACSTTPRSPPRRTSWAKAPSSPPRSTARNTRNFRCRSIAKPRWSSCRTAAMSAAAAS